MKNIIQITSSLSLSRIKENFIKGFKKSVFGIIAVAVLAGGFFALNSAFAAVAIAPATGGTNISIDTTFAGGSGVYQSISGPTITENSAGDIGLGLHTLTLPGGWEFDSSSNISIAANGGTDLLVSWSNVLPGATSFSFNVTSVSSSTIAILNFNGMKVRPTTVTPSTGDITQSVGAIADVVNGTTSFGTLSTVAGAVTKVAFTTQPTNTVYGDTFSATVNTQDQFGNDSISGLASSNIVTLSLNGTGIFGTTLTGNIGGSGTNGIITFSGLTVNAIGTGKTLTATPTTGTAGTSVAFDVTTKTLSATITASNKTYDGTTSATFSNPTPTNPAFFDVLTLTGGTATFDTKNVDTGKTVTATGLTLGGANAGNYSYDGTAIGLANIVAKSLNISATSLSKVYNGNTTAVVTLSDDRILDDVFTTSNTSADFADKNVGTGKTVTVNGISITGTDAGNYTFNTTTTTTAYITVKTLTVSATSASKVYDTNTTATITLLDDRVLGDVITLANTTATFDTKNVGTGKTVAINGISITGGTDAGNYTLGNTTTTTTANITSVALTATITVNNKVYDGFNTATILTRTLTGVIGGETVSAIGGLATFADKNVANGKTVSAIGLTLDGVDAGNYTYNGTAAGTADITVKTLTVSATGVNKVYDASTTATVMLLSDKVIGDDVTLANTTATFADKDVANDKTVSVSGISISGSDVVNYFLSNTTASATANITKAPLAVTINLNNKTYNGNTSAVYSSTNPRVLNGVIAGDDVIVVDTGSKTFDTKHVGAGKTVTATGLTLDGVDAGNYAFDGTGTGTANITARPITVTAVTGAKVYNSTTASVGTPAITSSTIVGTDVANFSQAYDNKNVGTGKTLTASGTVTDDNSGANYTYTFVTNTTGVITTKVINVTAQTGSKVYDGTVSSVVAPVVNTLETGDTITTVPTQSYDTKNVGTGKTLTASGLIINDGFGGANYTISYVVNSTGEVTAKALAISGVTASNKVYDTNTTAVLSFAGAALTGVESGDTANVTIVSVPTGTFDNANVATGKTVTITGVTLFGSAAGNYTVSQPSASADITKATPVITWANPTDIVAGTALSGTQLNASTLVAGSFAYSPTSGTVLTLVGSWMFLVTVPTSETLLSFKFGDWISGANRIATANNMRIYSAQSSNAVASTSPITITRANTYSADLLLVTDLFPAIPGRQVQVMVDLKVPTGTVGGSYSTNYGVKSL